MKTYKNLYSKLYSINNLKLAFTKARKGKTLRLEVTKFENNLKEELQQLNHELKTQTYKPKPLVDFIIRDPKTRKISKSHFRDRVVHHALCNIITPIFEKSFIYDSYANQINKGTLAAIQRFDYFKKKVTKNNKKLAYVFKADIRKYFETINHNILINIIKNKIKDKRIIHLIQLILKNPMGGRGEQKKGMPLGNLTSQFFANLYLNELDYFVKNKLKTKYYIRYVDDFIIFHHSKEKLEFYKNEIKLFIKIKLNIQLHPDKSRIFPIHKGTNFLGFKIFLYYKILKKQNLKHFKNKLNQFEKQYKKGHITYDKIYDSLEGWLAYAKNANTYKLRKTLLKQIENLNEISTKQINHYLKKTPTPYP